MTRPNTLAATSTILRTDSHISGFRFQLRDLLLAVLLVALALGWWLDHRKLAARLKVYQHQISRMRARPQYAPLAGTSAEIVEAARATLRARTPPSADAFVSAVSDPNISEGSFLDMCSRMAGSPFREEAILDITPLLADPQAAVRRRAVSAIRFMRSSPSTVVPALVPLIDDVDQQTANLAVVTLGSFGSDARPALPALKAKMQDSSSRLAAACAISVHSIDPEDDVRPAIIGLLKSPHADVRSQVVGLLSRYFSAEEIEEKLLGMFESERDQSVRIAILDELNKLAK